MTFTMQIAGRTIQIDCVSNQIIQFCSNYIADEQTGNSLSPDISIHVTQADIDFERMRTTRTIGNMTISYMDSSLEDMMIHRRLAEAMLSFHTILMHGAVVSDGEEAFMFTASSGVGKTTRARMFLDMIQGSYIINGDKPFISVNATNVIVHGTPWCGKENLNTNASQPLRAIFLLERAENEEPALITPIRFIEAYPFLLQHTHQPQNQQQLLLTLDLMEQMNGKVAFYRFRSTLDPIDVVNAYQIAKNLSK